MGDPAVFCLLLCSGIYTGWLLGLLLTCSLRPAAVRPVDVSPKVAPAADKAPAPPVVDEAPTASARPLDPATPQVQPATPPACQEVQPVRLGHLPSVVLELLLEHLAARWIPTACGSCRQMAAIVLCKGPTRTRLRQLRQLCRAMTVAAGAKTTAAISCDGTLYSWGDGGKHRQLGHAPTASRASTIPSGVLFTAYSVNRGRVAQVSAGDAHMAAVTEAGELYLWGSNLMGQLGCGQSAVRQSAGPTGVPFRARVSSVSAGMNHSGCVLVDGSLYMWGSNSHAQCGLGHDENSSVASRCNSRRDVPCRVSIDGSVAQMVMSPASAAASASASAAAAALEQRGLQAAGDYHTICCTTDGRLFSWGCGSSGRLGHGDELTVAAPQLVAGLSHQPVFTVAAGSDWSSAVSVNGQLYTFGDGSFCQLGHGSSDDCWAPTRVRWPLQRGGRTVQVIALAAGKHHGACVDSDGVLYTWGDNTHGQLGVLLDGTKHSGRWPLKAQVSGKRVAQVSCGGAHTVCVTESGSLLSWGKGLSGQLGHGNTASQTKAREVSLGRSVKLPQGSDPLEHWLSRLKPTNV